MSGYCLCRLVKEETMSKYFALLRPETIEEVKQAMEHFASTL